MSAEILDGKAIAKHFQEDLQSEVAQLNSQGIQPNLTVLWVGEDPASGYYFRAKEKLAGQLGIEFDGRQLPESTTEAELLAEIEKLSADTGVHGILVEFPLPKHISSKVVQESLNPKKDVDGLTLANQGKLFAGKEEFIPATPFGVMKLLEASGVELQGKHAVVVGRSEVVGKPLAMLLLGANATVTLCHSRTRDLSEHTLQADVLCAAVGVPELIKGDMVREGSVVVDIGYNYTDAGVVGDVEFEAACERASHITPVKGGVGAMTSTMVLANTVKAAKNLNAK
jgi:methylenetetrahydrofolate dehydrogenase (NADP+)/methenyltetrahydrofolate cyclohydrolase